MSFVFMLGLYYFIRYTKTGKAVRAVSEDKDVASLMGIDVNRTIQTDLLSRSHSRRRRRSHVCHLHWYAHQRHPRLRPGH
ncbi:MAG: hypothetical protein WEB00_12665 [Dehalococcoidia bacterium]